MICCFFGHRDTPDSIRTKLEETIRQLIDENVTTDVLGKVCAALDCKVEDIIDFFPDEED